MEQKNPRKITIDPENIEAVEVFLKWLNDKTHEFKDFNASIKTDTESGERVVFVRLTDSIKIKISNFNQA